MLTSGQEYTYGIDVAWLMLCTMVCFAGPAA